MMKKFRNKLLVILTAAILAATTLTATASSSTVYDPTNDAVVMVSGLMKYTEETIKPAIQNSITEQLKPVLAELEDTKTKLASAEEKLTVLEAQNAALSQKIDEGVSSAPAASNTWEVIYLTTGQKLLATSPCAIILRAGAAVIVSPFNGQDGSSPQGISDLTAGMDLLADTSITSNHHLLVPRGNDGRGIQITSEGGAYIMVQGGYEVVE
ncbi:MAG: hypothetical protein IJF49_05415 [Clostridia bacterium]|nr:hypothetical protein [Clostridia bacterium]